MCEWQWIELPRQPTIRLHDQARQGHFRLDWQNWLRRRFAIRTLRWGTWFSLRIRARSLKITRALERENRAKTRPVTTAFRIIPPSNSNDTMTCPTGPTGGRQGRDAEEGFPKSVRMRSRHLSGNDHVQQREIDIDQNIERQRNPEKHAPENRSAHDDTDWNTPGRHDRCERYCRAPCLPG